MQSARNIMWHEDVDWWELVWFVGVKVGVHAGVVSLLCTALMVVERYKLFPEAKIQTKVTHPFPSLASHTPLSARGMACETTLSPFIFYA